MSCVAEANAVTSAQTTMGCNATLGLASAMPARPHITAICATSNQLRLRPSARVRPGSGTRSTIGAHIHLKP